MIKKLLITTALIGMSASAYAVPVLQVGNGSDTGWVYDGVSDTWITGDASSSLEVTALSGAFTTDSSGNSLYTTYLVVSAVPGLAIGSGDAFDISFGSSPSLTAGTSGWGAPPVNDATANGDTDDLANHSIYPTYWETYSFNFDMTTFDTVCNQEPGSETDCTSGWAEIINFTVNSMIEGVTGLHFDLYTVDADGDLYRNAPFSHDAEYQVTVPEPATLALFGLGLIGFGLGRRRKS